MASIEELMASQFRDMDSSSDDDDASPKKKSHKKRNMDECDVDKDNASKRPRNDDSE